MLSVGMNAGEPVAVQEAPRYCIYELKILQRIQNKNDI